MRALLLFPVLVVALPAQAQRLPPLSGTDLGSGRLVDVLEVSPQQLRDLDLGDLSPADVFDTVEHRSGMAIRARSGFLLVADVEEGVTTADCTSPRTACAIVEAAPDGRVFPLPD